MPQIFKKKLLTGIHSTPHTTIQRKTHGHDNFSQHISNHTPVHHSMGQHQITSRHTIYSEEIPQLEEDLDNGQFGDTDTNLINRHNTRSESERIRKEYTEHLLNLSDNQYYSEENPINQLQYSSPDPDYYGTLSRTLQTQPHDPTGYYSPPQIQQMFSTGMHMEEENKLLSMDIDFSVKRPDQQKAGKPERDDKTINSE